MRMERINESQVRCVISTQDLTERHLTLKELKYGSRETTELFHEMLSMASEKYQFNEEQLPIMVEAIPLNTDELMLIISVVEDADELDPHFARYANVAQAGPQAPSPEPLMTEPSSDPNEGPLVCMVGFPNIEAVARFARDISLSFRGRSLLYKHDGRFYLTLFRGDDMSPLEFLQFLNTASEYGEIIPGGIRLFKLISEHENPVMENPLVTLAFLK